MSQHLSSAIKLLLDKTDLSETQMHAAMTEIMTGQGNEPQIAALLTALKMKGETAAEIVGAAQAMHEQATPIPVETTGLLDTCGTGGDSLHTFNISTATALVVAAVGVPIAKHGNKSVSSTSGSSEVLTELGVNIEISPKQVARCIDSIGIGFCYAPLLHGAMKYAAPIRRQLGFPTIFNLLGPLTNPAGAEYQLLGSNRYRTAELIANALNALGRKKAIVVCGANELDEVSLWDETWAFEVCKGSVKKMVWKGADFGMDECDVQELRVTSAGESADVIRNIFANQPGPARDMVVANAAAALLAADHCTDLKSGVALASEAIRSGKAKQICQQLVDATNSQT